MPTPEELAREKIDKQLDAAGCIVHDKGSTYFDNQSLAYVEQARDMVEGD